MIYPKNFESKIGFNEIRTIVRGRCLSSLGVEEVGKMTFSTDTAVINKRLPNPFMPDAPQRIAMDTSQKLAIRCGETLKGYEKKGLDKSNLVLIPLVLALYARYLKGIDDNGNEFIPSPDPLLNELTEIVKPLEIGKINQDYSILKNLYTRKDIFGVDLYEYGLGDLIENYVKELFSGFGAVRSTLHKYVTKR